MPLRVQQVVRAGEEAAVGMTRATGGPVRCPWCARPVSDGPGSPEACPSCGVPLSASLVRSRPELSPVRRLPAEGGSRRSQRLRALATVLALTAVMLIVSAVGVAAAVLRTDGSDARSTRNLQAVLRASEEIRKATRFADATPVALQERVAGVRVTDRGPSTGEREISMAVTADGEGWYGAVRSRSGRCFAAGTVNADPKELTAVLSGNCTGDAARAALMPLTTDVATMDRAPVTVAPSTPAAGSATAAPTAPANATARG